MRNGVNDLARDQSLGDRVPRFVLVEPDPPRIGPRLASIGWYPIAIASTPGMVSSEELGRAEVLVVRCTERLLLSSGFQACIAAVSSALPRVAVVDGNGADTPAYAARLGWTGFTDAEGGALEIARTIAVAARGDLAFPLSATSGLVRALARIAPMNALRAQALTPRQRQIVSLIAQGATDAEIATLLQISPATATKHVQNARRRLQARTRGQLVAATSDLTPSGRGPARRPALGPLT